MGAVRRCLWRRSTCRTGNNRCPPRKGDAAFRLEIDNYKLVAFRSESLFLHFVLCERCGRSERERNEQECFSHHFRVTTFTDVALQPCQVLIIRLRNRPYTTARLKP